MRRFAADGVADQPDRAPPLLTATLLVLALTNAASALAPDYASLLVIRLVMLASRRAVYAAGRRHRRADRAGGKTRQHHRLYLSRLVACRRHRPAADHLHRQPLRLARGLWRYRLWRLRRRFLLLAWRLPRGLVGSPVDLKTWTDVGRNRMIVLLLSITTLQMSGQFVVFTFMGPLLMKLTHASPDAVGLVFALYGIFGFIGIA